MKTKFMLKTNKKMKKILSALIALFVLATLVPGVMASMSVEVGGSSASPVSVVRGETVPIKVTFSENTDYSDAVVEAELRYQNGKKVEVSSSALDLISETTYVKTLNLKAPEDIEATSPGEVYALTVNIKDGNGNELEWESFDITVQRTNNQLEIQKVLKTSTIEAGKTLLVTAVVKNTGSDRLDDVYVKMSIPELGLTTEERAGDLVAADDGDKQDTESVVLSLKIPSSATQGAYSLEITAYNNDAETTKKDSINIAGTQGITQSTEVYANKVIGSVAQGETSAYKFTLLNVGGSSAVYSVSVQGIDGWATAAVNPASATVQKDSTATLTVYITADKNAALGQHIATVTVKSGDTAIKQLSIVSEVTENGTFAIDPLLITAVILAIILIVLVAVFVKTRKSGEKLEEENYY
jgi:uncharacterized membrane protein